MGNLTRKSKIVFENVLLSENTDFTLETFVQNISQCEQKTCLRSLEKSLNEKSMCQTSSLEEFP